MQFEQHHNYFKSPKGLNAEIIAHISAQKNEPAWMLEFRLKALEIFEQKPMPTWAADLSALEPHDIHYYVKPLEKQHTTWNTIPSSIKKTFDALGIPQAEQRFLAGVGAQFDSEVIYKNLKEEWSTQGVVFCDMSQGLQQYPNLFQHYFATVIPAHDNKFAALNSAVWSGGSFVYIPAGVQVTMPLQAYFRINAESMGQFERTLIIAEPGSSVHYVEGCSAPMYSQNSLHSAVVEIIALEKAQVQYTTIQNWSTDVYNLVTKRAIAYKHARVSWIDGNFGSKVTMKYPAIILKEEGAQGEIVSLAVAGNNQHQDSGGKIIHCASNTRSSIIAKSISKNGGRSSYRGLIKVLSNLKQIKSKVQCDALLLDELSRSDTYPTMDIKSHLVEMCHEASVNKISDEQIFYLMSRGFSQAQARALLVNGFIDALVKLLPMEYAVEINRLIALEMEDSIG